MTNITKLYQQLQEGKTTRDYFVREARRQFPQFISPVSSYNDIVNILKGKRLVSEELTKEVSGAFFDAPPRTTDEVEEELAAEESEDGEVEEQLNEAHKLDTEQILDRMSPYAVRKGIEVELKKEKVIDKTTLDKVRARVAKKLQKNKEAYNDQILTNTKDVEKKDKELETKEVKQELVDKKNAMRKPKGFKAEKANTKASKKENKKGKPKGVKVMPDKGVTGTEKVIGHLKEWLQENVYRNYNEGMEVKTPHGMGIVKEVHGGTLTVELEDGSMRDYQFNVVNKAMDAAQDEPIQQEPTIDPDKAARDAAFAKLPGLGSVKGTDTGVPKSLYAGMTYEEKLKAIMEKVQAMEEGEKKQKALEIVKKKLEEAGDAVIARSATGEEKLVTTTPSGKGKSVVDDLKRKGITTAKSISLT